jgi:hypothetical protein
MWEEEVSEGRIFAGLKRNWERKPGDGDARSAAGRRILRGVPQQALEAMKLVEGAEVELRPVAVEATANGAAEIQER